MLFRFKSSCRFLKITPAEVTQQKHATWIFVASSVVAELSQAQLVEHSTGNREVMGSTLLLGLTTFSAQASTAVLICSEFCFFQKPKILFPSVFEMLKNYVLLCSLLVQ